MSRGQRSLTVAVRNARSRSHARSNMTALDCPKRTEPRALARAMPRFSVAPNRFEIAQAPSQRLVNVVPALSYLSTFAPTGAVGAAPGAARAAAGAAGGDLSVNGNEGESTIANR